MGDEGRVVIFGRSACEFPGVLREFCVRSNANLALRLQLPGAIMFAERSIGNCCASRLSGNSAYRGV